MDSQEYLEIRVHVPDEQTGEIVMAQVADLGFDAFDYSGGIQLCYIQTELYDEQAFAAVIAETAEMMGCSLTWTAAPMPREDWNSEWERTGFTPIECGDFIVLPYLSDGEHRDTDADSDNDTDQPETGTPTQNTSLTPIYLDPKMAFGTGHHQTTFMMMQAMQDLREHIKGADVVDLGCGTAVLAILAAKLGASGITAIDINEVAVRSSLENIRLNGEDFSVLCGNDSLIPEQSCDILLANIHRNILIEGMPVYARSLRPGGLLLISGFLESDITDILQAAAEHGFHPCDNLAEPIRKSGEWVQIALKTREHFV